MTGRVRILIFVVAAIAVATAIAFGVRTPLRRALFLAAAQRVTGLVIDADGVDDVRGGYSLTGVRAHTRGGAVILEAPRAFVSVGADKLEVAIDEPRVAVASDRLPGEQLNRLRDALEKWHGAASSCDVRVHDGTLTLVEGEVPVPYLRFGELTGNLDSAGSRADYNLDMSLLDGSARYAVQSRSVTRSDGSNAQRWTAPVLPLAPLVTLLAPAGGVYPQSGWLSDIVVDDAPLHASVTLSDVALALDGHALHGLHGTLTFDGDGVGSPHLAGTLDAGVPFDASGEVHDLPTGSAWLRAGSKDLRALAGLTASIANEPRLRSVSVEATAPGLLLGQYGILTDHGPLAISVLSIDPGQPTLRFDTALAEDSIVSGGERTSAMGVRTGAVAGVNGDYFDIGRTYQPQGMLVRSGRLLRGPTDRAVLAIDSSKRVRMAEFHLRGTVVTARGTMPVTEFNDWPPGKVAVITPDFGKTLHASQSATFVRLAPLGTSGTRFRVTEVVAPGVAAPVGFGIAIGTLVGIPPPRVGETVELSYRTDPVLTDVVAAIGGGPILLRDGAWYEDPHAPAPDERNVRWPVIALARERDDRLLLVAVDGRHPERSVGATRPEFAQLLQRLGGVDAIALDSGGSVTLVSRKPGEAVARVRNVVSDFSAERWISDALFLYSSAPPPSIVPVVLAPTPVPEARPTP